jgi:protein-tyrosine phosphatase
MPIKRILMVCLGNICRSPMAEGILKKLIQKHNLDWEVDSAGTAAYHVGEAPDARAISTAYTHHVDISSLSARQFIAEDFRLFDHILVMDGENYNNVMRLASSEQDKEKVELLLNYLYPKQNRGVRDPWYSDDLFDPVFQELEQACARFVEAQL